MTTSATIHQTTGKARNSPYVLLMIVPVSLLITPEVFGCVHPCNVCRLYWFTVA